jgi:tetratricopeptide (TPR) repeat protein
MEAAIRPGMEVLRAAGETGFLSTSAVVLAEALYQQGRYDEGEEAARHAEELAAQGDVASQMGWRYIRAKLLARRGRFDEAEALAYEAAGIARQTDHLYLIGVTLTSVGEVLRMAGKTAEAKRILEEALEAHQRKGSLVMLRRTERLLRELAGEG